MKFNLLFVLWVIFIWVLSAVMHESDLSRNFKKTGDAKAWFFEIKQEKSNENK